MSDDPTRSASNPVKSSEAQPKVQATELSKEEREQQLSALDESLAEYESRNRWADYNRTLLAKAELVADAAEQVELFRTAGVLFIERSSNQTEAMVFACP